MILVNCFLLQYLQKTDAHIHTLYARGKKDMFFTAQKKLYTIGFSFFSLHEKNLTGQLFWAILVKIQNYLAYYFIPHPMDYATIPELMQQKRLLMRRG